MFDDISLVLCIDDQHLTELTYAWKTWKYFKPEITQIPNKILLYDKKIASSINNISFLDSSFTLRKYDTTHYKSQRDAMLTSWFEAARFVRTKFYLKIDTDCFAINNNNEWIKAILDRDNYKIISNPWGYTKYPDRLKRLDDWGDSAKNIMGFNRLNLIPNPGSNKIIHPRIISFFGLFDTEWTRMVSESCWRTNHYELPDPSQDTFTWYCAHRRQDPIKRVRFKRFGFVHTRLKKMRKFIDELKLND